MKRRTIILIIILAIAVFLSYSALREKSSPENLMAAVTASNLSQAEKEFILQKLRAPNISLLTIKEKMTILERLKESRYEQQGNNVLNITPERVADFMQKTANMIGGLLK